MKLEVGIVKRLHLSEQEVEDLKAALAHDQLIVATLSKILALRKTDAVASPADYDKPNWPYRRAYIDGRLDELQFLINLFELNKE
jgi:hypothetical protein